MECEPLHVLGAKMDTEAESNLPPIIDACQQYIAQESSGL